MNFINETDLEAGWTIGRSVAGQELLVFVVKGTYVIPPRGEKASLAEEQAPLVEADEFTGEPSLSSVLYETDYSQHKPYCDVLFNGSAYAPEGQPRESVQVLLTVGAMTKSFTVCGDRHWQKLGLGMIVTSPEPFLKIPISYDNAFGGVDASDPDDIKAYLPNPVGRGFYAHRSSENYLPMPNTEEIGRPVKKTRGHYTPMALGPIGRSWPDRLKYTGTYDEAWTETRAPFWPEDFDERYFQAAPPDQQIPYPKGGESVVLQHLTPEGHTRFALPEKQMPILVVPHRGAAIELDAVIDTVVIEPDLGRFSMTWRASLPLRQSCFEIKEAVVDETKQEYDEYTVYMAECCSCRGKARSEEGE